ncbi:MAG: hypothetical protein Q4G71_04065 [Pseudomonadota bacterium]|nr:hypothetical protein [Pseudomonadota bacterium]
MAEQKHSAASVDFLSGEWPIMVCPDCVFPVLIVDSDLVRVARRREDLAQCPCEFDRFVMRAKHGSTPLHDITRAGFHVEVNALSPAFQYVLVIEMGVVDEQAERRLLQPLLYADQAKRRQHSKVKVTRHRLNQ